LDGADIFRIVEKLSPVIEAIGVLAIPVVIWFMTESGQKAKEEADKAARAQEAVKTYLNQLSTVFLDGNLEKDERLQSVTRASTLALLNDPNLDGWRKGEVIKYLAELKLVQVEVKDPKNLTAEEKAKKPLISLAFSNLGDANLDRANLRGANLEGANLKGASLWGTDLSGANLGGASLSGASLWGASLRGADLSEAFIKGADLSEADLRGADLRLGGGRVAVLTGQFLSEEDLRGVLLCQTKLQSHIKLDPNRDCKRLRITP
jgi:uncharacterized protein YjbI with pentapeptide repeats